MATKRFSADVYQGHTTDCGVIVPFDPSKTWKGSKPLPIGYRKLVGHAVQGTIEGAPFEGWIFHYFRQWRMVVPGPALDAANVAAGEQATFTVRPHPRPDEAPPFTPGPKLRGAGSPRTRSRRVRPKR